jgi:uncharacterized membrane protein
MEKLNRNLRRIMKWILIALIAAITLIWSRWMGVQSVWLIPITWVCVICVSTGLRIQDSAFPSSDRTSVALFSIISCLFSFLLGVTAYRWWYMSFSNHAFGMTLTFIFGIVAACLAAMSVIWLRQATRTDQQIRDEMNQEY